MLARYKRLIVAGVAAASLATIVPAQASVAVAPCQGRPTVSFLEWHQSILVTGQYWTTGNGAIEVRLTCGVVRQGVTVARVTDKTTGPAAALAEHVSVLAGAFNMCHDIDIVYLTHTDYIRTCP